MDGDGLEGVEVKEETKVVLAVRRRDDEQRTTLENIHIL